MSAKPQIEALLGTFRSSGYSYMGHKFTAVTVAVAVSPGISPMKEGKFLLMPWPGVFMLFKTSRADGDCIKPLSRVGG